MANYVGIFKYENLNYFDSDLTTCIDKIQIDYLPLSSFPIFDLITEDINGVGVYKAGDFAVTLLTTGGETSVTLGESVSTFFRGGTRNYKFLIGIQFGTQKFWGTFTNADVEYDYKTKKLDLRVAMIDYEAKEILGQFVVGAMNDDRTLEDFFNFSFMPSGVSRLLPYTSMNYSTLIGGTSNEYMVRWQIQYSAEWVNTLSVWQQMIELLLGTGLLYTVTSEQVPNVVATDFPVFVLTITYLDNLTASTTTPIIFEAHDRTFYNKRQALYIKYRNIDLDVSTNHYETCQHGIIVSGNTTKKTDTLIGQDPDATPVFVTLDEEAASLHEQLVYLETGGNAAFPLNTIDTIGLNLYQNDFFDGLYNSNDWHPKISYPRIITSTDYNGTSIKMYEFAMNQYKRYVGNVKRQKVLRVKFDDTTDYGLYKTIPIMDDEQRQRTYYISEMRNLDFAKKRVELTCIEV